MRIGIAQLWQETNTFNPLPTTRSDFEEFGVLRGADLIEQLADTNEPGGFIQSLAGWAERPQPVGLVRLPAWPSGRATTETFDWICDEFASAVEQAAPLDGLLLALHGALVADGHPDVEGELLERVRAKLGRGVPLVATLDLHANVTQRMAAAADVLVPFHTAPHIDVFETGVRAAAVLRRILIDHARPVTAMVRLPMVPPAERANTQDPQSVSFAFREQLARLEAIPEVLAAGLATVQPWLDIPELGSAVLVTTDGQPELATAECERLAAQVWQRRKEYLPELTDVAEAVSDAHAAAGGGLTVLSDAADATTSGAPGDSTWVLAELLKHNWPRGAAVTVVAPEMVDLAASLGPGESLSTRIGGRRDTRFSTPLKLTATVERTFDARFVISGHLARNLPIDMGRSAVLRAGSVHVVVTSRSGPHFAPELFQAAGIDPFALDALVAKSPCGFRAAYAERASRIVLLRSAGCAPSDFWNYPYVNIPRPLWPWDDISDWQPKCTLYHSQTRKLSTSGQTQ